MSHVLSSPLIRVLPEQLANQIAAGEVVERPASVIKELIENSLDAQATQIEIEVEAGGIKKILVRDNGCGISQDQLALAICRHATSKIETVDDLQAIDSLGFRGEALASIGSVSRLQLTSRIVDEDNAWCLSSPNGVDQRIEPAAHPVGTSLEVCDLFYNTPARRKFLRSDRTEFRHLDEVFRRMALGRFDVGFQLKHNHRVVQQLRPAHDSDSRQRRLHKLFGKAFVQQSSFLDMQASGLRLWGWLSQPDYSRSQADQQYFYVNGRIIRDRIINHAIRQAYQPHLYPGRQAAYVLHLELDEGLVDVNVHPTKHEVRFRESRLVHDFIYKVVSDVLSRKTPEASHNATPFNSVSTMVSPGTWQPSAQVREPIQPYRLLTETQTVTQEQGLVLLNLQAAREQVYYQCLQCSELPLQRQPVLVPLNLSLTPVQVNLIEAYQLQLQDYGFDVRITGPQTVMLLHMPVMFRGVNFEALLLDLFNQWQDTAPNDQQQLQNQLAQLAAQHFRLDSKIENRNGWLEKVAQLPSSAPTVWRLISTARLAELIQHG